MDQKWKVCELEESSNILLTLFERFSVVAVPESWISLLENGTQVCFWPSVDAGRKIRSLHRPKDNEKCSYFKCRILLDGARFSTYKEAKAAELIAQNVSSIMDSSVSVESQGNENICKSSMAFDVSDADMSEIDRSANPESFGFNVTPVDNNIVGHDSCEYNNNMLKRPYFSNKAMVFDVENVNETFDECDYNANFKLAGSNFLTSTVIDEIDFPPPSVKSAEVSDALSKISSIKSKLSAFVSDILDELNEAKQILLPIEHEGCRIIQEKDGKISGGTDTVPKSKVFLNPQPTSKDKSAEKNGLQLLEEIEVPNVEREQIEEIPLYSDSTATVVEIVHYGDVSDEIRNINETFVAASAHDLRPNVVSVPLAENVPINTAPESPPQSESVIKLPLDSISNHVRNEDLLWEDDLESALIEHLAPFANEDESAYMNRTTLIIFTEDFFLNQVSWKKESNRINIKHSKLLSCWKASYKRRFNAVNDDYNKKFQEHFRRMKSAMRAAIKAGQKRKLNGANPTKIFPLKQTES